jgi:hypothetical protein
LGEKEIAVTFSPYVYLYRIVVDANHPSGKRTREPNTVAEWKQGTEGRRDPDGYEAFAAYEHASGRVDEYLRALSRFWKACHLYLSGYGDKVALTKVDAMELTNEWPKYQEEIENTMNTIMEAADAVMVDAKGLPPPKTASKPGETSTFQTISSALVLISAGLEQWTSPRRLGASTSATHQLAPNRTVNGRGPMSSEEDLMLKIGPSNFY